MMISTSYKAKLRSGLTYSISAKQISEQLSNIAIYDLLKIIFDKEEGGRMGLFVPGFPLRRLKGNSQELLGYREIISGYYSAQLDQWRINLRPISKQHNIIAKEFLIKTGLPLLRKWFDNDRLETWFEGNRYYQIGLSENLVEYCTLETHNDHIIHKKINKIIS